MLAQTAYSQVFWDQTTSKDKNLVCKPENIWIPTSAYPKAIEFEVGAEGGFAYGKLDDYDKNKPAYGAYAEFRYNIVDYPISKYDFPISLGLHVSYNQINREYHFTKVHTAKFSSLNAAAFGESKLYLGSGFKGFLDIGVGYARCTLKNSYAHAKDHFYKDPITKGSALFLIKTGVEISRIVRVGVTAKIQKPQYTTLTLNVGIMLHQKVRDHREVSAKYQNIK